MPRSSLIVGYAVYGPDNNTWMWDDQDPKIAPCPTCHIRTDFFRTNPNYVARKRFTPASCPDLAVTEKTSFVSTYDSQWIVTQRFKAFCESEGYKGLYFGVFGNDPFHFHFRIDNQVELDQETSEVVHEGYCSTCGNYRSLAIHNYMTLKLASPLGDGFYRTDLLLGGSTGKGPVFIVGSETRKKIVAAKIKKIDYDSVYGIEV